MNESSSYPDSERIKRGRSRITSRLFVFGAVIVCFLVGYYFLHDQLTLDSLAQRETELRDFQQQHPWLVYGIAFSIYVLVAGLSLPGALVLTLVYGWYFNLLSGVVLVSFASTTGATMAFLLSRFLFRDTIENRFGDRLRSFNQALEREGPFFLFTLRLIPAIPFFVINAVMGLTPIKATTFWWVSQLGMLPATIVFVYAGASVPNLQALAADGVYAVFTPWQMMRIVGAFVLLGIFPLAVRFAMKHLRRRMSPMTR